MKRVMNLEQLYNLLAKGMGFLIGWIYFFLKVPDVHAFGEFMSLLRSFVYGGIGAVGAWFVKTYVLKRVDACGGWKPWLKSIFKRKSK